MSEIQNRRKSSNGKPWSDDELRITVDSYLYMLRLEVSGVTFSAESMARSLTKGLLPNRNDASLRYRMRNISYVVKKRHLPIVQAYSPASSVGAGVKQRIEKLLDDRSQGLSELIEITKEVDHMWF